MNLKCKHEILWDDSTLWRHTGDILILTGTCKLCDWGFRKQYIPSSEMQHDYELNLLMPYDLSNYKQDYKH